MAGNPSWMGSYAQQTYSSNNTTWYGQFGDAPRSITTEAQTQMPSRAGVYSMLGVYVKTNTRTTNTTVRIRKNGANGSSVVTIGSGVTGFLFDSTNTDTFADGDLMNYSVTTLGSGGNILLYLVHVVFTDDAASTTAQMYYAGNRHDNLSTGNRGYAFGAMSGVGGAIPAPVYQHYAPAAGTLAKLYTNVTVNTHVTTNSDNTVYINGSAGTGTTSYAPSATGAVTDTTHTDSVSAADGFFLVNNGNNTRTIAGIWWYGTTSRFAMAAGYSSGASVPPSDGSTIYISPFGSLLERSATEADVQAKAPFGMVLKTLRLYYDINNNTTAQTYTVRVNGADTSLTLTVPGSGTKTGLFTASVDVAVAANDLISIKAAGGNSSSNMSIIEIVADSQTAVTALPGVGSAALTGLALGSEVDQAVGVGSAVITGYDLSSPTATDMGYQALTLTGLPLGSEVDQDLGLGTLAITGYNLSDVFKVDLDTGSVSLTTFDLSQSQTPGLGAGGLTLTGNPVTGYISGPIRITQMGLSALGQPDTAVRASGFGLDVAGVNNPVLRASGFGLSTLAITLTRTRITQMGLLVLAKGGTPPVTPSPLNLAAAGRTKVVDSRIVNMYYEPTPDGPSRDARFGRPGLVVAAERGGGPVTANFDWQGFNFTVSGDTVWRDNENIGEVIAGPDTRFATSDTEIVIVTGGRAYYVTTTDVTPISDIDMPDPVIDVLLRSNGRFIYLGGDGRWYYSEVGDARTIDGLSFATADQAPDNLVGAINVNDSFVLFGTGSGEWWYDTGDNDAPFQRSNGRAYRKGLAARQTLVEADNSGFFLGSDRVVYRMGADPIRVSTYDVEDQIRRVPQADLSKAWAFSTFFGGHTFYVLSLPGQSTWAFDISQNKWQEWKSWGRSNFRVRVANGPTLGDNYSGKIMSFDQQTFTDLTEPLERIIGVYLPVKSGNTKNWNLMLGALRGVGLPTGYGSQPVVEMRYSDGDGRVWSNWMEAPLGVMGDFGEGAKAIWDQLGSIKAPGRLYEFRVTDPVEFTPYIVKYNELRP